MSTIDTAHFRELLLDERGRVERAIAGLRDGHPGSMEDEAEEVNGGLDTDDLGETASDHARPRDRLHARRELAERCSGRSTRRWRGSRTGTYGTCTNCGNEISVGRLEAHPWASLCIDCARLG